MQCACQSAWLAAAHPSAAATKQLGDYHIAMAPKNDHLKQDVAKLSESGASSHRSDAQSHRRDIPSKEFMPSQVRSPQSMPRMRSPITGSRAAANQGAAVSRARCPLPDQDFPQVEWRRYLRRVYGTGYLNLSKADLNVVNLTALANTSALMHRYVDKLQRVFPRNFGWSGCWNCGQGPFVTTMNVHTPLELAWRLRVHRKVVASGNGGNTALSNHSWVEVTHCGGSHFEQNASYFYHARGSGMWIHVGYTIAFGYHDEAVLHFLGKNCSRGVRENNGRLQCDRELNRMAVVARQKGYESVQFLRHCDAKCDECLHEIAVLYGGSGRSACPNIEMRRGSRAQLPCTCVPRGTSVGTIVKPNRGPCATCAEWL